MKELLLTLLLAGQSASSISGQILSVDGTPAVNMRVSAVAARSAPLPRPESEIPSIAQTDDAGRYRLENLPAGRYYVAVGLVFPTYFPGVMDPTKATLVTVNDGTVITGADFSLPFPYLQPKSYGPPGMVLKTIYLAKATTAPRLNDIVTGVRILFDLSHIAAYTPQNAIILRDTPDKVALVERTIAALDEPRPTAR